MIFKIYTIIDQLLSVETSRTITRTIINLFQSGAVTDGITFILTRQFYQVLVNTLDLQYENILLAASTAEQMQAVIWNKWPFFTNYTNVVEKCLRESNCDTLQEVYQDHGKDFSSSFFSIHILQMPTTSSESCPSTRST